MKGMGALALSATAIAAAMAWAPAPVSAQGFEGTITQRVKTIMPQAVAALAGEAATAESILEALSTRVDKARSGVVQQNVTIRVKGRKMRIDGARSTGAAGVYSILDASTSAVYTVVPAQKIVVVATPQDAAAAQKQLQGLGLPAPSKVQPKVSALGTARVGGVQAHGYRLVTPNDAAVVWIDPRLGVGLAAFDSLQAQMAAGASALQSAVLGLGFPVQSQMVTRAPPMMGQGWMFSESKILAVKREGLPDALFALPAFRQVKPGQSPPAGS